MKNSEISQDEKMLMIQWEQEYADRERLQQLLFKLDSMNFVDVASVAHGPQYKTGMRRMMNHTRTTIPEWSWKKIMSMIFRMRSSQTLSPISTMSVLTTTDILLLMTRENL